MAWDRKKIYAEELAVIVPIPEAVLDDSDYNIWGEVQPRLVEAFGKKIDCLFAQVVRIRDKKARAKRLDKQDQEFYRRNRELVDIRRTYTESEQAFLKEWGAG